MKRTVCRSCPWKRSTPRRGFPGGRICVQGLADAMNGGPGSRAMQCHATPDGGRAKVCVGFALVVGSDSFALRLAKSIGRFNAEDVAPTPDQLHTPLAMIRFHGGV